MIATTKYLPLLALLAASPALAQSFGIQEWKLTRLDTGDLLDTEQELEEFFNKAHCDCAEKIPMELLVRIKGDYQNADYEFQVVAGRNCLDTVNQTVKDSCVKLFGPVKANTLTGDIPISNLNPKILMESSCAAQDRKSFEIVMFTDSDDDGKWEEDATKLEYTVDTQVPDQPKDAKVIAGEGQVKISFTSHTSATTSGDGGTTGTVDKNFKGYQVLCETTSGAPALSSPKRAEFRAAINVCGESSSKATPDAGVSADGSRGASRPIPRAGDGGPDGQTADTGAPDGPALDSGSPDSGSPDTTAGADSGPRDGGPSDSGTGASGSGAESLDEAYVCSSLQQSAGEVTVGGLKDGETYRFYIVTIDDARNPSEPLFAGEGTPELAEDLWERYKRLGGPAEGGYCFVATAVHGSYNHPHVRVLREFRDRVLLPSREGRLFVQLYYATGPVAASWITRNERARTGARALLWPVTVAAAAHLYTGPWQKALVLLALALGIGLLARRRGTR